MREASVFGLMGFSSYFVRFPNWGRWHVSNRVGKVEGAKVLGKIETPFEKMKVAAYTLSAISPCMRLFEVIAKEIQALLNPDDGSHLYKKWID
ncbi:hypothetical protein WN944_019862 [Citrus x changshan-huyou]|uniref:Uncharacterized protein n=1 Tax=Citrus x changshan-huyou TaxID=2935761 RepID=A0AAP0M2E4_9ROSI